MPRHEHAFTFSHSGATITATCADTDGKCKLPEVDGKHTATLTIGAPTTGNDATITVSPEGALTGYAVKYQTKSGSTWGDETENAPSEAGIHKATVTLDGKTASVTYGNNCITYATGLTNGSVSGDAGATCGATITPTITPDEGYQLDALTVTPEEGSGISASDVTVNGGTFIMPEANITVSATFKEITYTVEANGAKATVTDSLPTPNTWTAELTGLPADKTYDGKTADLTAASVLKSDGFPNDKVTVGEVSFKDKNNSTVTTATDVGIYTASATVGDKVISKTFEIAGRTPITYYIIDNDDQISQITTSQYIPIESNRNRIVYMRDGMVYAVKGDVTIGALVYSGNVTLILCEDTTLTIRAGIYHIGSRLNIYTENGSSNASIIVNGESLTLSDLEGYSELNGKTVSEVGASISGDVRVHGGGLTVNKGSNQKLIGDDFSLTLDASLGANELTGGTENADGSVTYGKAAFANLTSAVVKPVAVVKTEPKANTLAYTGSAQELVTAGTATGGTIYYAVTTENTAPADNLYTTSIPTATDAGT